MTKLTYKANIDPYLLEMESHNTYLGMRGVAWRQMVEQPSPTDALGRQSTPE